MTPKQTAIFEVLKAHGPLSVSDVAKRLKTHISTTSVHLQHLAKGGHAHNTSRGCRSEWHVGPKPDVPREHSLIARVKAAIADEPRLNREIADITGIMPARVNTILGRLRDRGDVTITAWGYQLRKPGQSDYGTAPKLRMVSSVFDLGNIL